MKKITFLLFTFIIVNNVLAFNPFNFEEYCYNAKFETSSDFITNFPYTDYFEAYYLGNIEELDRQRTVLDSIGVNYDWFFQSLMTNYINKANYKNRKIKEMHDDVIIAYELMKPDCSIKDSTYIFELMGDTLSSVIIDEIIIRLEERKTFITDEQYIVIRERLSFCDKTIKEPPASQFEKLIRSLEGRQFGYILKRAFGKHAKFTYTLLSALLLLSILSSILLFIRRRKKRISNK